MYGETFYGRHTAQTFMGRKKQPLFKQPYIISFSPKSAGQLVTQLVHIYSIEVSNFVQWWSWFELYLLKGNVNFDHYNAFVWEMLKY